MKNTKRPRPHLNVKREEEEVQPPLPCMPRMNEPEFDDWTRGVRDAPRQVDPKDVQPVDSQEDLGETSDEAAMKHPIDLRYEMTPGQEVAFHNPDVQSVGPPGGGRVEGGFDDDLQRRD